MVSLSLAIWTGKAAREIGARRADIGLYERVMGERRVAADIGERAQCVPRRQHHAHNRLADPERLTFHKGPIEVPLRIEDARHV